MIIIKGIKYQICQNNFILHHPKWKHWKSLLLTHNIELEPDSHFNQGKQTIFMVGTKSSF
jgi:hypothetical protein